MWLHLSLLKQRKLFAQEEVPGCQCAARPRNEQKEVDENAVTEDSVARLFDRGRKREPGMNATPGRRLPPGAFWVY
jgi:hypothetical protein